MREVSGFRRTVALLCAPWLCATAVAQSQEAPQSLQAIRAAAESHVRAQIGGASESLVITAGALDPRLRLAPCAAPLRTAHMPGAGLRARLTVGVSCREGTPWTVYVPVSVESEVPVLVLRRPLARGARVAADDVEVRTRRVPGAASGYIADVRELEGRSLKRPLPAGAALTADALDADVLVRRGQQVTLVADGGGIEVRAPGRALADARAGERVRVQNESSRLVVEGMVQSEGVIRVTP